MTMTFTEAVWTAWRPNTSPEKLKELSTYDDWAIRCHVAQNPNTLIETLKQLANDEHGLVRNAAMRNPNATEEVIILAKATNFILLLHYEYYL
jgi:hypothetical protein